MARTDTVERIRARWTAGTTPVAPVVATALGFGLLLESFRVWLPSVIFIYGRAGSTPATQLGGFALVPFLLALLAAGVTGRLGPRRVGAAGAAVLVVGRLALQAVNGGDPQLWTATVAVLGGLVWLVALAAGDQRRGTVAVGLAGGLAVDALLEVLLLGDGLAFRDGVGAWVLLVPLLAAFAAASVTAASTSASIPAEDTAGWPWLAVGPVLVLHGVLAGSDARAVTELTTNEAIADGAAALAAALGAGLVAVGYLVGVERARTVVARHAPGEGLAAAIALVAAAPVVLALDRAAAPVTAVILGPFLGTALAVAVVGRPGRSGPRGRALAAAGGLLIFFVLAFLYYAAYDLALGVWNGWVLVAAGVAGAVLVLAAWRPAPADRSPVGRSTRTTWLVAAVGLALLASGSVAARTGLSGHEVGDGLPLRIVTYNVHMGFDTAGRYVPGRQADVLEGQQPDVVVLNEVDRGWYLNGTQDVLTALARRTDLPYLFAPAADAVWGNAILSRYPVVSHGWERLPRGGAPMARSVLWAILDVGAGDQVAVVVTHLHHVEDEAAIRLPQARRVAELARELHATGRPVVVLGDLNAELGDPELAPLEDVLQDAVGAAPALATFPSWGPQRRIDHILTTSDLRATDVVVPRSEASDHLAVAVTLHPAG